MDDADRTASTPFEVPPDLLPALERAARRGVKRATEYDQYTHEVQERILEAARLHAVLRHGRPGAADVATLAEFALLWTELPGKAPMSLGELHALYDRLSTVRELIVLRDDARGRTWPQAASDGVTESRA